MTSGVVVASLVVLLQGARRVQPPQAQLLGGDSGGHATCRKCFPSHSRPE